MAMINNMIQTTNEQGGERKKLAFLYDIGCNIEKGIHRVSLLLFQTTCTSVLRR
jgi:hypothetical protein